MAIVHTQAPKISGNYNRGGGLPAGAGIAFENDIWFWTITDAPTNGTSGDGAGWAGPGSLLVSTNDNKLRINTNTLASPTWTVVGAQTA